MRKRGSSGRQNRKSGWTSSPPIPWGISLTESPIIGWDFSSLPQEQELWDPLATEEVAERTAINWGTTPLWGERYSGDDPESAFRWLTECWWTLDEAASRIELVPPYEFLEQFTYEWHGAFQRRQPAVFEKSRRMVISWASRGLETRECGLRRSEWLIVDQTHKNAAEHLWRVHFALTELYDRRPDLNLPRHISRGSVLTKEPTHVVLANGSIITQLHQEAGASQGKGKTGITLEEISKYAAPSAFWNQALIVVQGPGGTPGGWVCGIANADPNEDWQAIKAKASARELLGFSEK